jgi:predicted transcriptional regulator
MARYKQTKRSKLEIMNEILNLTINGQKKTHIMNKAYMSYKQLENYLQILKEKNLLKKKSDHYITTEKGRDFIKKFIELMKILGENHIHIIP